MKILKTSILLIALISIISVSAFADTTSVNHATSLISKIEKYVSSIDLDPNNGTTLYSHFLVKEDGFIFAIDFMLSETGEIIVLSKDYETEFYRVEEYNADHIKSYRLAVPSITE